MAKREIATVKSAALCPPTLAVALLAIGLAGCTSIEKSGARNTERALAAAGFQMKFADTPALREQVKKLPQRKLAHVMRKGKLFFVYADNLDCKCIYVGTEAAYQRYQKLSLEENIAADESMSEMDWNAWGAWGPWY